MPLKIQLLHGDITQLEVEAIVNSANNDFILGSGVSGAIHRLGGPEIQEECHRIGTRPLGSVATTTAGKLKAKYIIHAAVNPLGLWADAKSIRAAFRGVLRELRDKGIKSTAVPAIGTGAGAFSIDRCADILLEEVRDFAKTEPPLETLIFVLFDEKNFQAFEERFARKFPEMWTAHTDRPLPDLPPEPELEPLPPPIPRPVVRPPQRPGQGQRPGQRPHQGPRQGQPQPGRPPQPQQGQPGPRPGRRDRGRRWGGRGPQQQGGPRPPGPPPPNRPSGPPPPAPPPPA
ncbi:MAG TPA: macro domain-containing protein [Planctomycetota bacterium]|nr:macro domain-containing protein [Planctomycetota bacterium]